MVMVQLGMPKQALATQTPPPCDELDKTLFASATKGVFGCLHPAWLALMDAFPLCLVT